MLKRIKCGLDVDQREAKLPTYVNCSGTNRLSVDVQNITF
jgi:hypothetical protein